MRAFTLSANHSILRILLVGLALLSTVLVVTWPLAVHLTDTLPLGTEQEATVPLFNLWTLWWSAHSAVQGFDGYWQAPIFYPSEGTFTFSEPQLFTSLLVSGLWNILDSPASIYNLSLLFCLFLNGLFAYRLALSLNLAILPAFLCGMFMIGLPITSKLLGVLPLLPFFGMLWALEGFVRFGLNGSVRAALWAGTGLLVLFFSSQQLALLFGIFGLLAGGIGLYQQEWKWKAMIRLGAIGLGVSLIVLLYAWYPLQLHQSMALTRSETIVKSLSAHPSDYLSKPLTASIPFPPLEKLESDTAGLFPGLGILCLAGWGIVRSQRNHVTRLWVSYFLGMAMVAFLLSLGMNISLGGWHPFETLRQVVPGFHELRSPFRFAILTHISLAVLAAYGLQTLLHSGRQRKHQFSLVCVLSLITLTENLSIPQPLLPMPTPLRPEWAKWVQTHNQSQVMAHIPFPQGRHVSHYEIEAERMVAQLTHGKPMVNGYSGYFPPGYHHFQVDMAKNFPNQFLLCFLSKPLKVDTLIFDQGWYTQHQNQVGQFPELDRVLYKDTEVVVVSFPKIVKDCQ